MFYLQTWDSYIEHTLTKTWKNRDVTLIITILEFLI